MLYGREAHVILAVIMSKALARFLFPVLILTTGIAFALALSPSTTGYAHRARSGPSHLAGMVASSRQPGTARPAATPTPTPETVSQPGSTDGIVLMSAAIVAIIVLPILLQRALWMK